MPKKLAGVKSPYRPTTITPIKDPKTILRNDMSEPTTTERAQDSFEIRHYKRNLKPMIQSQTGYMMEPDEKVYGRVKSALTGEPEGRIRHDRIEEEKEIPPIKERRYYEPMGKIGEKKPVASVAPTRPNPSPGTMIKEGAKSLLKGSDEPEESALDRLKGMAKTAYNTVKAVKQ